MTMNTTNTDQQVAQSETLERSCLMCDAVRLVIAKVGPLEVKEPCPNVCKGGYFQPPGRIVKKVRSRDANS